MYVYIYIYTYIYIHTCFPLSDIPMISSRYHVSIMLGLITDPWYRICQPCDMVFFHSGKIIATWQRSHHQCGEVYHGFSTLAQMSDLGMTVICPELLYWSQLLQCPFIFCHEIRARKLEHTLWWTNIAIENGHRNSGFSIAMLVHQRVDHGLIRLIDAKKCLR